MDKKAQVTLFIVVGLIILALVGTFMYIREQAVIGEVGEVDISEVPMELRPVHNFINDIVYETAVEGLEIMGLQGGWISIDDAELSGETFIIHPDATSSEVLTFNKMKIPYWYFMSSPNNRLSNYEFSRKGRPLIKSFTDNPADRAEDDKSMEAQLDRYIEANLKDRLNLGLASLKSMGYNVQGEGDISATTLIGEEDISVSVNYLVVVESGDGKGELDRFFVRIPLNIKNIFSLADRIINAEIEFNLFDNTFFNWITTFQGLASELPPSEGLEFGAGKGPWIMSNAKKFVKYSLFVPFIPAIQLADTKNYQTNVEPGDENSNIHRIKNGILTSLEPNLDFPRPYDLSVDFFYHPNWDIYFNIDPHEGQIIRPEGFGAGILNIANIVLQRYKFFYDISVPVLIIIRDDNALNEEGFNFQFAIESNIRSNAPVSPGAIDLVVETDEETLFDRPQQRISGLVTIESKDNFGEAVEGVRVRFICGTDVIEIGETEINEEGKAVLVSRFPLCQGGFLSLTKKGYLGYEAIRFDPQLGEEAYVLAQI
ncbi:hypothetical protein ISS04_04455 [Candidatus Woesearchaeota archaeon]|nr:hypothetical protein [Candidatus Woesearchaeota archaeon]